MAEIREDYILNDRASGPLDKITRAMTGTSNAAYQAQMAGNRLASSMGAAAQSVRAAQGTVKQYESALNGVQGRMIRLDAEFGAHLQRQDALVAAGKQNTAEFQRLDKTMEALGSRIRTLQAQESILNQGLATSQTRLQEAAAAYDELSAEAERAAASADRMAGNTRELNPQMDKLSQNAKEASREVQQAGNQADKASSSFQKLWSTVRNSALVLGGIRIGKQLLGLSDTLVQTRARIDMMNDGLQTTAELQGAIYQAAQDSRGAFADTADLVGKLGTLAGSAFGSSKEIVAFAEQVNKHLTLSGTNAAGAQAAMLQLTQAMSSGVLRGEELNSILEQTPTIAQSIADYMGLSVGQMRELASEGAISASVVKSAMFAAADETNAKFKQMPMTWAQVWTQFQNMATRALEPVLNGINWAVNNMDTLKGVFLAVGAAAVVAGIGTNGFRVALWGATKAAGAFFLTLLKNPFTWIALLVGIVVFAIYKWIQAVGGLEIAWLKCENILIMVWDIIKIAFFSTVYGILNMFDKMVLGIHTASVSIQNIAGDMKAGFLMKMQDMFGGAIDLVNQFIRKLNSISIFGHKLFDIGEIDRNFGTAAAQKNNAEKMIRNLGLMQDNITAMGNRAYRDARMAGMTYDFNKGIDDRLANIAAKEAAAKTNNFDVSGITGGATSIFGAGMDIANALGVNPYQLMYNDIAGSAGDANKALKGISGDVADIKKEVQMDDETLKYLEDRAQRQYINRVNLTAQTPVINIRGQNTGDTAADRKAIAEAIKQILVEQLASNGNLATARP